MKGVARASARGAWLIIAAILPLCWAAAPAHAQFEVKSPVVEKGVLELEALGSVQSHFHDSDGRDGEVEGGGEAIDGGEEAGGGGEAGGGEEAGGGQEALEPEQEGDALGFEGGEEEDEDEKQRQGYEFSVGYGVTDYWKPELALVLEQRKGRDLKADALEFENTFQVLPTDAYFVNAGLLATFEMSLRDDVQTFELGPLVQLPRGRLTNTANAVFERSFGDDRETPTVGFEYAWQSVVDIAGGFGAGFEAFGEIEKITNDAPSAADQEHRIGPVALFEAELGDWGEIGIEVGFLFGLTNATPDNTFKFNLEYEWGQAATTAQPESTKTERGHGGQTASFAGWSGRQGALI
jgi:hypothetical protein